MDPEREIKARLADEQTKVELLSWLLKRREEQLAGANAEIERLRFALRKAREPRGMIE